MNQALTESLPKPFKGAALLMTALLFFAVTDATIKYLTLAFAVPFIIAIRYLVNWLVLLVIAAPVQRSRLFHTNRTRLVLLRGFSLVASSFQLALALKRMPVAETTAIFFLAPMVVILAAGPLLGERIRLHTWLCGLGGVAGVVLIARPGSGLDPVGVACAIGSVLTMATYHLMSRALIRTESTMAMLFYTTMVGAISFGILLPWIWPPVPIHFGQWVMLIGIGLTGGVGHYFFTAAFRHAAASRLAPINYVQLVWAVLLGWAIFGHVPDMSAALGMAIIGVSGVSLTLPSLNRKV